MDLEAIRDGVRAALVEKGVWQRLRADLRTHVHGIVAGTSGGKAAAAEAAAAFRSSDKGERAKNSPRIHLRLPHTLAFVALTFFLPYSFVTPIFSCCASMPCCCGACGLPVRIWPHVNAGHAPCRERA